MGGPVDPHQGAGGSRWGHGQAPRRPAPPQLQPVRAGGAEGGGCSRGPEAGAEVRCRRGNPHAQAGAPECGRLCLRGGASADTRRVLWLHDKAALSLWLNSGNGSLRSQGRAGGQALRGGPPGRCRPWRWLAAWWPWAVAASPPSFGGPSSAHHAPRSLSAAQDIGAGPVQGGPAPGHVQVPGPSVSQAGKVPWQRAQRGQGQETGLGCGGPGPGAGGPSRPSLPVGCARLPGHVPAPSPPSVEAGGPGPCRQELGSGHQRLRAAPGRGSERRHRPWARGPGKPAAGASPAPRQPALG